MPTDPEHEPLRGRRTLVTGGGGFIGAHLTRRLAGAGAEVHTVGRSRPANVEGSVRSWACDLSEPEGVRELMESVRPEMIYHLSSAVTGSRELEVVGPTFESNLASTVHLLVESTRLGCDRVVLAGSMEEPRAGVGEPVPPSPYAAAKWASTAYASMFHALYDSPVVVLTVFMVYGPGQGDPTKLIPYVGRCFLEGVPPKLSSGRRSVDWVYVDDVVEAFLLAGHMPTAVGRRLDVGSGTHVTIREAVERLARIAGTDVRPEFGALADRPLEREPVADLGQTKGILGWRARTDLDEGLRRTFEWLRSEHAH